MKLIPEGQLSISLADFFEVDRGTRLTKSNREGGSIPLVTAGYTNDGIAEYVAEQQAVFENAITIDMFGDSFWRPYRFSCDDNVIVLRHDLLDSTTAFFFLSAIQVTTEGFNYSNQYRLKDLKKHLISIPVLGNGSFDFECIRDLSFSMERLSSLRNDLTAELTAENITRKKQYFYYRERLFDGVKESSQTIKIAELGKWSGGKTPSTAREDYWDGGTIPWITSKDMKNGTLSDTKDHITSIAIDGASMRVYPKNCIAVVVRSGILKHTFPVAFIPFETTVNQDIKMLIPCNKVLPRYAYHVLNAYGERIRCATKKRGGTVDSLDLPAFLEFEIPLPDKATQEKVVSILDKYETTCCGLNEVLSSEIEARKKQHEYYRDLLMSSKEMDV